MELVYILALTIIGASWLKQIIIGDFNFYYWMKYGKKYKRWYFDISRTRFPTNRFIEDCLNEQRLRIYDR